MFAPLPPVPTPTHVNVESTLGCNLACVMCGSHLSGVTKLRRAMGPAMVEKVEREVLPGAEELSLTVAGEPFLTPRLPSFVAVAERTGAALALNTNGTLVKDSPLVRRVLAASSVLRFSVDGATPETYAAIRGNGDLDLVLENIRGVVAARKALPRDQRPRLVMCAVLMRRNLDELVALVELAHGLGLDRLDVAHLTVLVPEMEQESLRHEPERTDEALAAAQSRADALGFRVSLPPLMSGEPNRPSTGAQLRLALGELGNLSLVRARRVGRKVSRKVALARWSRHAGGSVPCDFLQNNVFITIQGEVAPCPMPGRPLVGDLHDQSFADIWNGETLTAMRRGFIEGKPFDCCAHCSQNPHGYDPHDPATVSPPDYHLPGLENRVLPPQDGS
jgi:MoaA/NifB/PqqE/SkfB family radical SAM enzyme